LKNVFTQYVNKQRLPLYNEQKQAFEMPLSDIRIIMKTWFWGHKRFAKKHIYEWSSWGIATLPTSRCLYQ